MGSPCSWVGSRVHLGSAALCATLAGLLLLSGSVALAETHVTYNINDNTVWTVGGSPYIIHGTNPPLNMRVLVNAGNTLVIDPGVEVRFMEDTALETDPGGAIVAVGAPGDTIVFRSDASEPAAGDWLQVHVYSSSGSQFSYCLFEHAKYGLYFTESDIDVQRCAFRHCENGVFTWKASPSIVECWITDTTMRGAWLYRHESEPTFYHCNFMRNAINMRLDGYTLPVEIEAESNWWGVDDDTAIAATIQDGNDPGGGAGTVDFDPWLEQVPVEQASWSRIKALFR